MTDFKKIAADGFEINAKTLDTNPDDAAARSYMLGVMMAKHLDEAHVQRAKRYVIDQPSKSKKECDEYHNYWAACFCPKSDSKGIASH